MIAETKRELILNEQEIEIVLKTARYNKINKLQWLNKGRWLDEFDETLIELTEEEKHKAIDQENNLKHTRLFYENMRNENRARLRLEKEALAAQWNYAKFYYLMRANAYRFSNDPDFKFLYNEQTSPFIKAICYRLSFDPRYETELGFKFINGLIVRGGVGLGKTDTVKWVADNPVNPVQVISMRETTEEIKAKGVFTGLRLNRGFETLYIDDVGTEYFGDNAIKHYGTEVNWFKDLIEETYLKDKRQFCRFIFSTNDDFDVMGKKYGFRVRDRLAERFDVLNLTGKSMRRK